MLLSLDGTITHLNSVSSDLDLKKKGNNLRAPVLVYRDESSLDQVETDFGYSLPRGWKLARSDNGKAHTGKPSNTNLKPEKRHISISMFFALIECWIHWMELTKPIPCEARMVLVRVIGCVRQTLT
jgi:hypothetical protein